MVPWIMRGMPQYFNWGKRYAILDCLLWLEQLKTDEDLKLYFEACTEEDPGDGSLIRAALGDITRARRMTWLARSWNRPDSWRAL